MIIGSLKFHEPQSAPILAPGRCWQVAKKKRRLVLAARLKVPWPLGFLHAAPDA